MSIGPGKEDLRRSAKEVVRSLWLGVGQIGNVVSGAQKSYNFGSPGCLLKAAFTGSEMSDADSCRRKLG